MSILFRKKSNVFEKISHVFVERSEYSFYGSEFIEIALRIFEIIEIFGIIEIFEIIGIFEIIEILSDSLDFVR